MSIPNLRSEETKFRDTLIDRAVAAVCERCAKIASDSQYEDATGPRERAWNDACKYIADTIRGQKENSPH